MLRSFQVFFFLAIKKKTQNVFFTSYSYRLMSPQFADGLSAPRISVTGNNLPLSRVVSRTMHPDDGYHDHAGTVMVIAWGQFMDHDYTLTGTPLGIFHSLSSIPQNCPRTEIILTLPLEISLSPRLI